MTDLKNAFNYLNHCLHNHIHVCNFVERVYQGHGCCCILGTNRFHRLCTTKSKQTGVSIDMQVNWWNQSPPKPPLTYQGSNVTCAGPAVFVTLWAWLVHPWEWHTVLIPLVTNQKQCVFTSLLVWAWAKKSVLHSLLLGSSGDMCLKDTKCLLKRTYCVKCSIISPYVLKDKCKK